LLAIFSDSLFNPATTQLIERKKGKKVQGEEIVDFERLLISLLSAVRGGREKGHQKKRDC